MSEDNPLTQAHALSAEASTLIRPANASKASLERAAKLYGQAAELFGQASRSSLTDEATQRTLHLLTVQNSKLVKDVERKLAALALSHRDVPAVPQPQRRASEPVRSAAFQHPWRPEEVPVGLGAAGRGWSTNPGIASRLSPSKGLPPFAVRPLGAVIEAQTSASSPSDPVQHVTMPRGTQPGSRTPLSPIQSSSSSSDFSESFVQAGGGFAGPVDTFSRFWETLDTALDEVSNPVAFARADIAAVIQSDAPQSLDLHRHRREEVPKGSPSHSFYVVPEPQSTRNTMSAAVACEDPKRIPLKSPEELALENENLRASLDAMALHAHEVERTNKALLEQMEERQKMIRALADGVRREAYQAKQGHDLMRSQLLASQVSPLPVSAPAADLAKRLKASEQEIGKLQSENDKLKTQVQRYRDRFERIKASSRAKRGARDEAAAIGSSLIPMAASEE